MGLQCCPLGLEFGIQTGEVNDGQTIFTNLKIFADHLRNMKEKYFFYPKKRASLNVLPKGSEMSRSDI